MMFIVQMLKLRLRKTKTSQLAELQCVSGCFFSGQNYTKPKVSTQETGAVGLRVCRVQ